MELGYLENIGIHIDSSSVSALTLEVNQMIAPRPVPIAINPVAYRLVPSMLAFSRNDQGIKTQAVMPQFLRSATPSVLGSTTAPAGVSTSCGKSVVIAPAAPAKVSQEAPVAKKSHTNTPVPVTSSKPTDRALYSVFDAEGFPTVDANGETLTKNQYKKIRKLFEVELKKK